MSVIQSSSPYQSLCQLADYTVDSSWFASFRDSKDELERIELMLHKIQCNYSETQVPLDSWFFQPSRSEVFRVFKYTVMSNVKVIILGMDPYPGLNADGTPQACGIAFSAEQTIPASLRNIFLELKNCDDGFNIPTTGDLRPWCKQGVLLINASLTFLPGSKSTQKEIWLPLVHKLLGDLSSGQRDLVVCLWGRDAQGYQKYVNGNHLVITSSHPSPLSATKGDEPFIGSRFPIRINEYLTARGAEPINWQL